MKIITLIKNSLFRNNCHLRYVPNADFSINDWLTREVSEEDRQEFYQAKLRFLNNKLFGNQLGAHNLYTIFVFVVMLSAYGRDKISILDWGSGLGKYYFLCKTLPIKFEYNCYEVPAMCKVGKELNPEAIWYSDDSYLQKTYDLIIMSGSLQYCQNWKDILRILTNRINSGGYLFLNRVVICQNKHSFTCLQDLEKNLFTLWIFNKYELSENIKDYGLSLEREFLIGGNSLIKNSPEECQVKGFLFKK